MVTFKEQTKVTTGGKVISDNIVLGVQSSTDASSLSNLTIASGSTPSTDAIEKETGVKNTINNFGRPISRTTFSVLTGETLPRNTGIDSLKIDSAASVLNTSVVSTEQVVSPGVTTITNSSASSEFSRSLGSASALAIREGFVDGVAVFVDSIETDSIYANTIVNKLPNSTYRLTGKGATVMNSMRSPNSALGVRNNVKLPWENPETLNNNKRMLDAETGSS